MINTTSMHELMQIVEGAHADPHHILGMHEQVFGKITYTVVRAYNPDAASVEVINIENNTAYALDLLHMAGFFAARLPKGVKPFKYTLRMTAKNSNTWEIHDPYSFMPVISDLDMHLFGQGTHYEIFEKMGAHPMTIDGVEGVLFAVWAPNARRISVVGDFNNWNGTRNPMRALSSSGIWELFIPGLQQYDNYKFEIKSNTGALFQKNDPYANFNELRPGWASLVYDINGYEWKDSGWTSKTDNPLDGPINIYELHPGSWKRVESDSHRFMSWPELTAELIPYVKEMGYTHIELMPVTEFPFDGSWGYQVTGFFAPTSRYGNPTQFMEFVDNCHQNNIGVLMDWVPAHFPKDAHGLASFDGTPLYEHSDPRQGEHPDWGTLIFNYGRNEVKNFLISNALFWLEKYHIDGLRVDAVASMLYLDYGKRDGEWVANSYGGRENLDAVEFMKHMNSVILGKHPNALMVAEESTAWGGVTRSADEDGLGFTLKWNMGWMNDFLTYMTKDSVYRKYHHNNITFGMVYAYTEKFVLVLSHDEVVHGKGSMVNKMPGDVWQKMANLRAAYGFMMGHPGKKLLFMGGEFAQFDEWSEAKSLDWFLIEEFELHKKMHIFTRELNHLYLRERALWQHDFDCVGFDWINCDDAERSTVSFFRQGNEGQRYEYLVFICNFTPSPHIHYRVGVPVPGDYVEILNSDKEEYGGSGIYNPGVLRAEQSLCDHREYSVGIQLPPLGVVILKTTVG